MFKQLLLGLAIFITTGTLSAAEIDKTQPYIMMKQVSKQTFERLKSDQDIIHKSPDHIKVIVEQELMPYFNEKYAALKLLGPNLKGAKRDDVAKFIASYRTYIVSAYAQFLTQYTKQEIEFIQEPLDASETITSMKVAMIDTSKPDINFEFKLRKDKKTGEWKAFGIITEGAGLLSSRQSEWSNQLRQYGILAVAKDLEELAARPIRFESEDTLTQNNDDEYLMGKTRFSVNIT
ncbi:phospholipid transport system substrate-binding protein [Sinobacterium caligoides]|uniref:Phospholipid transport system substrate-binding protein n=1 Tax=Sinobacterium caligoides TaxID=933926 RepID=A0A3N2E1Q2_9GAMM|nr:ABC transporter substrate-binding protein [Sinobacterium caligoides]ROS05589.1 phospholipid transport system substrate-binding protein [Sinobacterium caligoides]